MRSLSFLLAVVGLATPSLVWAHAGALPQTIDLVERGGDGPSIGLETTFGLLLAEDGDSFRWVCHETIIRDLTTVLPNYHQNQDGVLLASTRLLSESLLDARESVYRSVDGCNWVAPLGLTDALVADLAFDPANGDRAVATLGALGDEVVNGIRISNDGGLSWSPASVEVENRLFRDLVFASGGQGVVWTTANWFNPLSAHVLKSEDSGATWSSMDLDFPVDDSVQVLVDVRAVSYDGSTAWLVVNAPSSNHLLRLDDFGGAVEQVLMLEDTMDDMAIDPSGAVWLATRDSGLYRSSDGLEFVAVDGAPHSLGIAADHRGLFAAVDINQHPFALSLSSDDGATFAPLFEFGELLGPLECSADSDSAQHCDPVWDVLAKQLGGGDDDDSSGGGDDDTFGEDDPSGDDGDLSDSDDAGVGGDASNSDCHCTVSSTTVQDWCPALLLLTGLMMARRRRWRSTKVRVSSTTGMLPGSSPVTMRAPVQLQSAGGSTPAGSEARAKR